MPEWLDTRTLGEMALIAIGAIVLGYVISKIWPKQHNPGLFGTLAALTLVGGLAYMGNTAAALALGLLIVLAVSAAALGIVG